MMADSAETEDAERTDDGPRRREPARRLFAAEFNDARFETSGVGERAPTHVVTPLGARVSRLFVVGVLTSNDPAGEDGDMRRAQITDPTGVFYLFAGRYQPEALEVLEELDPPQIVGVVGKARTYEPEEGTTYTSIRPERIHPLASEDRDDWILQAAEQTLDRVQALDQAYRLEEEASQARLVEEGVDEDTATGIMDALGEYGNVDLNSYLSLVSDALGYLLPAPPTPEIHHAGEGESEQDETEQSTEVAASAEPSTTGTDGATTAEPDTDDSEKASQPTDEDGEPIDAEGVVLDLIDELDEGDGALWDDIVQAAQDDGLTEEQVEETMNVLMDRGRVFEPVLGKLKKT